MREMLAGEQMREISQRVRSILPTHGFFPYNTQPPARPRGGLHARGGFTTNTTRHEEPPRTWVSVTGASVCCPSLSPARWGRTWACALTMCSTTTCAPRRHATNSGVSLSRPCGPRSAEASISLPPQAQQLGGGCKGLRGVLNFSYGRQVHSFARIVRGHNAWVLSTESRLSTES